MDAADIPYLSAGELLAAYRERSLSPVEVVDALIDHVERHEPALNAVIDRRYDEARAEARVAEARWTGADGGPRPLEGVPVAAKEEHPMRGRSWAQGSLTLRDLTADEDHPIIERIQAAGGIIHIRTATPEFCCAGWCHSRLWGVTRNPWNLQFSPGGSSGGSGTALAAGYAPVATGSDIGGSIRIPASLSGVVGFKPPHGRVPALPPYNLDQFCHDGPMARTVADCALLEDVIAGPDRRDQVAMRFPPTVSGAGHDVRGMRVALCTHLGDFVLDDGIEANTRAVADALAAAGAEVTEVTLPWRFEQIWQAATTHFAAIMGAGIKAIADRHGELLCDYTHDFVRFMHTEFSVYEGMELEGALWQPLGEVFEWADVLLTPTMATAGFVAGDSYLDGISIGGQHVPAWQAEMTMPFNLFSRCPVMAVPSGRAPNGVPTGVQVVARTHDDVTAVRVAAAVELAMAQRGVGFGSPQWRPAL
jgi:aspartyl-tRNA(Asn)/glutamyl-tRNA(Gln) amidotransferase subunit A